MRIFLLTLLTALVIAPSQASAASTGCDVEPGPYAPASHDQTVVSNTDWQKGNPLGSIKVPLVGTDVDAFEYSVDCGAPVVVNAASSSATITGEGELRFRHRARVKADAVSDGGLWTDWVEETVRIDSGRPANETPIITSEWRPGPAQFPVRATDTTSPAHVKWRVDEGSWNTTSTAIVDGTGVHTLDTAAVDSAGNESQMPFTVSIDNEAPVDRTQQAPVDFQSQAVDLTVDGADAHSGVKYVEWQIDAQTPHSGPDGTIVRIDAHGKHTFQTRVVDKVGNKSAWRSQNVWIQSPTDLTKVSTGWYTTPTVKVDIVGTDSTNRQLKRIQWRLDDQPEQDVSNPVNNTVPVTVSGDRDHELAVRMTDADDNVLEWHSHRVKIDTVHPTDLTKVADGWLPQDSLTVDVHGSDATSKIGSVEWRIDDGNDNSAPGDHHDVTVAGEGIHTLETRVIDNAGKESAWVPRTIKLDPSAPTNLTPIAPTGWRNTPYSVTLDGSDALSDVASVSWKVKLEGLTESAERSGAAGAVTAAINQDGTHTLSTRVRDLAGIASAWRTEVIQIDRVLPTDATVYPSTPVNPRHVITFNPQDDRSGVANVEWSLDGATASTDPSVTIKGTGAHTLSVNVTDNANNKTGWVDHTITVVLPPDKTAPTDKTSIPTNWLTDDYTVTLAAEDDIDGVGVDYVEWRLDGSAIKLGKAGDTFPVKGDGAHRVDTRVRDKNGNRTGWNTQTVRIDKTPPTDSSGIAGGWAKTRTISFKADDASSGVEYITYDITGPSPKSGTINASSGTVTLASDGEYTINYDIYDVAGQMTSVSLPYKADTVNPANTSLAALTAWQTPALKLAITGSDDRSGVDHGEWRVDGGATQTGSPALVTSEGTQLFETRVVDKAGNASAWRPETIKVDHTKPTNTTALPDSSWIRTDYARTVTGSDAHSGVQRVEYSLDGGATQASANVSITAEGTHTLATRVIDVAGNASDWRTDTIGIDRTVPSLAVDCGTTGWRNTQAACSVAASGGLSGLASVTANGTTVVGGSYAVPAEGATTISFRAVDGAGNETTASADVKVDTTLPTPAVTCANGAGAKYVCTASATDAVSGVASLAWSVDGSVPVSIANGGTFSVAKGSVVVYASDNAGNGAASSPVALVDRSAPAPTPTPRTGSEAVLLRKGGAPNARLVGQLAISSLPTSTTIDLRPLAIGKGSFQFVFKIKSGKKSKTVTKTQTVKTGYSTRISVALGASSTTSVALTVRKKSGKRWISYASAAAKL